MSKLENVKLGDDYTRIIYVYPKTRWMNIGAFSVLKLMLEHELQKVWPNIANAEPVWAYFPDQVKAKIRIKRTVSKERGAFHVAAPIKDVQGFCEQFTLKHPQYRCYFFPDELKDDIPRVRRND